MNDNGLDYLIIGVAFLLLSIIAFSLMFHA